MFCPRGQFTILHLWFSYLAVKAQVLRVRVISDLIISMLLKARKFTFIALEKFIPLLQGMEILSEEVLCGMNSVFSAVWSGAAFILEYHQGSDP